MLSSQIEGIPVEGSQIVMATNSEGYVTDLQSSYNKSLIDVDTQTEISEGEAKNIVLDDLMSQNEVIEFVSQYQNEANTFDVVSSAFKDSIDLVSEQVIFSDDEIGIALLCYKIKASTYLEDSYNNSFRVNLTYYVIANGENCSSVYTVINNEHEVSVTKKDLLNVERTIEVEGNNNSYKYKDNVRNIGTYNAQVSGHLWWKKYSLPGNIAQSTIRNDKTAVSLHANMEDVYNYYKNILKRNSFDGKGAEIKASYNFESEEYNGANAYWNPTINQFVYVNGETYVPALDIMAHEFTHAVITYSVKGSLRYEKESGALNESYADIMGSLIEGKDDEGRWLIGEDSTDGKALRSLKDPKLYEYPNHYRDRFLGREDNGGVHTNSSIFNHAAYLMMTDDATKNISKEKWAKVFYKSLRYLTSTSNFLKAKGAIISAAKKLNFTDSEIHAVRLAFEKVGIVPLASIRVMLTWGESPSDLDSHMIANINGTDEKFHVFYSDKVAYSNDKAIVELGKR